MTDHNQQLSPLQLQAFFDGELDDQARAQVEAQLESDQALQPRLDALDELGQLVRAEHAFHTDDVDLSSLWTRIDAATAPRAAPAPAAPSGGLIERLKQLFERHRPVLVPTFAAAFAAMLVLIPMLGNEAPVAPSADDLPAVSLTDSSASIPLPERPEVAPEPSPAPDATPNDATPPQIFVFVRPPERGDDWFVSHSNDSPFPVIWSVGASNAGQPEKVEPNTPLWPVVQEALQSLPERFSAPNVILSPRDDAGDPHQGPF